MTDLSSKFGDSVDWKRITAAAACVLFLSASAAVTFYVTHTYEAYINSDSAAANVLAAEIWRTGQFFPKDWWYVNSDLWVLFKQVFILPWAMAGNNGFAAHSSSVLAGSALLIASGYALLRQVGSTQARAILGASALCFGFSDYYLETVFGEAAYSWQAAAFFILLLLLLKIRKAIKNNLKTTVPLCGLLTLISLFTLANPQRFLVFFIAPVIGAVLLLAREKYLQKDIVGLTYKNFKRGFFCIVPCGIAFVLALFLHRTLLSDLANAKGVSEAVLVPLETLPKTLGYTLLGIANSLGVGWVAGIKLASVQGLFVLIKFCVYPMLLVAPALALSTNRLGVPSEQVFLVLTGYFGLVLISFLVYASSLQGVGLMSATHTTRYILPYLLLILLSNFCVWPLYTAAIKLSLTGALTLALASSWGYLSPKKLRALESQTSAENIGYTFVPGWRQQVEKRTVFLQALAKEGLTIGYAPYWHSHPYTVLSKGAIEVRPVHLTDGNLRPWLHLSSSRWYKTGYTKGEVFVLVPKSERAALLPGLLGTCMPTPTRQLELDDYLILVYPTNPLLGAFDRNLDGEGSICMGQTSRSQIGKYNAKRASLDSPASSAGGYLHYGPYSLLEPSEYAIKFAIEILPTSSAVLDIGYVEVTTDNGARVISRQRLAPGIGPRLLNVSIRDQAAQNVELRVYSTGAAPMSLLGIEVRKIR